MGKKVHNELVSMYAFSSIYAFVPQPVSNLITNFTVKSKMSVLENSTSSVDGTDEDDLFVDLFTDHQLKSGAIILYIIGKKRKYVHLPLDCGAWKIQNSSFLGIIYMIIAFYLLCKEYLVPSLFAIADKGSCSKSCNNLRII